MFIPVFVILHSCTTKLCYPKKLKKQFRPAETWSAAFYVSRRSLKKCGKSKINRFLLVEMRIIWSVDTASANWWPGTVKSHYFSVVWSGQDSLENEPRYGWASTVVSENSSMKAVKAILNDDRRMTVRDIAENFRNPRITSFTKRFK